MSAQLLLQCDGSHSSFGHQPFCCLVPRQVGPDSSKLPGLVIGTAAVTAHCLGCCNAAFTRCKCCCRNETCPPPPPPPCPTACIGDNGQAGKCGKTEADCAGFGNGYKPQGACSANATDCGVCCVKAEVQ